jgi:hypothetical protein
VTQCTSGVCQRFTWNHNSLYQLGNTVPVEICFRIWLTDLTASQSAVAPTTCAFYTTPYDPSTKHQVTGPASAVLLTIPFSTSTGISA